MKTKTSKKKKAKVVRTPTPGVPKDLKGLVLKKYRSKDRSKRFLAVRLPMDTGCHVVVVAKDRREVAKDFLVPNDTSQIPANVWLPVCRELSTWYARTLARTNQHPSNEEVGRRRRRALKRSLAEYHIHLDTKQVVDRLKGTGPAPRPVVKPQMRLPYLCFYNPLSRKRQPVFTIHTAYCAKLDQARKRCHNKGGTSWVIEAAGPAEAIRLQVAEFKEDDKGYEASDFDIHECAGRRKLVTSKTTLGRIVKTKRRGK